MQTYHREEVNLSSIVSDPLFVLSFITLFLFFTMESFRKAFHSCFGKFFEKSNISKNKREPLLSENETSVDNDNNKLVITDLENIQPEEVADNTAKEEREEDLEETTSINSGNSETEIYTPTSKLSKSNKWNDSITKAGDLKIKEIQNEQPNDKFKEGFGSEFQENVLRVLSSPTSKETGDNSVNKRRTRSKSCGTSDKRKSKRKDGLRSNSVENTSRSKIQHWARRFRSLANETLRSTKQAECKNRPSDDCGSSSKAAKPSPPKPSRIPVPVKVSPVRSSNNNKERRPQITDESPPNNDENVENKPKVLNLPDYETRRKKILEQLNKKMLAKEEAERSNKFEKNKSGNNLEQRVSSPEIVVRIASRPTVTKSGESSGEITVSYSNVSRLQSSQRIKQRIAKTSDKFEVENETESVSACRRTPLDATQSGKRNKTRSRSLEKSEPYKYIETPTGVVYKCLDSNRNRKASLSNVRNHRKEQQTEEDPAAAIPNFDVNKSVREDPTGQTWTQAKRGPKQVIPREKSKTRKSNPQENSKVKATNNVEVTETENKVKDVTNKEVTNVLNNDHNNSTEKHFTAGQFIDPRINDYCGFQIYRKPDIHETPPKGKESKDKKHKRKGPKGPSLLNL